jgi:predicted ABC-type ATPase
MPSPTIYVIAGCNGAGKTTFAKEFLPHEVKCLRFYNADEIARGLSPLDPSAGAIKAGRLLLGEVRESIDGHETFALESTLSGKTYARTLSARFRQVTIWSSTILAFACRAGDRARATSRSHGRAQRSNRRHPPSIQAQPQSLSL